MKKTLSVLILTFIFTFSSVFFVYAQEKNVVYRAQKNSKVKKKVVLSDQEMLEEMLGKEEKNAPEEAETAVGEEPVPEDEFVRAQRERIEQEKKKLEEEKRKIEEERIKLENERKKYEQEEQNTLNLLTHTRSRSSKAGCTNGS